MIAMHTDKNAGLGATMFFGRSGERATFVQLCKDLCATKGALLFLSIYALSSITFLVQGSATYLGMANAGYYCLPLRDYLCAVS